MNTSSGRKKTVAVLLYKHSHGADVTVHRTADGAERQVYKYMRLWMSEVPEEKRKAIYKAIREKRLRDACTLWAEAQSDALGWGEDFEIYENMTVMP